MPPAHKGAEPSSPEDAPREVRLLVAEDGTLVSDDLPSGVYNVSAWWSGAGKRPKEGVQQCDISQQTQCEVWCTVVEGSDLICEGLASGTYRLQNTAETGAKCEVDAEGDLVCNVAEAEEGAEEEPVVDSLRSRRTFRAGG